MVDAVPTPTPTRRGLDGRFDWTMRGGHTNSGREFTFLITEVERLVREGAHSLLNGRADQVARVIMAQLAHVHDVGPLERGRDHARDVLVLAAAASVPDTYWHTDSRILRACETLGLTPDDARTFAFNVLVTE